jgi:formylglycine-generating enzyme required for sulfatase activity
MSPAAGEGAHANIPGSGWDTSWNSSLAVDSAALVSGLKCDPLQTWTDQPAGNEHRPINCVTWYEAMAFCAWDGGYLPTDAEWNYAAAGGDQQRAYPWSNPAGSLILDSSRASYSSQDNTDQPPNCVGDGMPGCAVTDLIAVGTKPMGDGRWGQSELAGNVYEWTLDWVAPLVTPCTDCATLSPPTMWRSIHGGSFSGPAFFQRTVLGTYSVPSVRNRGFGVRCARPTR